MRSGSAVRCQETRIAGHVVGVRSDVPGDYRTSLYASGCDFLLCACVTFVVKRVMFQD